MKIQCNIAKDLMPLYIDEVLSEESKAAVEEHLTGCEGCREYYRKMHDAELPGAESKAEEVLGRLDEAERLKKLKKSMLLKRIRTIAATAVVVALIIAAGVTLIFHTPSYIPYEDTGIRMTENGDMYVDKPYYEYRGEFWGKDGDGNRVAIFFLTSSYYSRNWEKVSEDNRQHVMRFHAAEDPDAVDKVYYLPEKYVKENKLQGLFSKDNTLFDHIYRQSTKLGEEQMQAEIDKLIAEIEGEATVVWSAE